MSSGRACLSKKDLERPRRSRNLVRVNPVVEGLFAPKPANASPLRPQDGAKYRAKNDGAGLRSRTGRIAAIFGLLAMSAACQAGVLRDGEPAIPAGWLRFRLAPAPTNAAGAFGIFDPSFASVKSNATRTPIYMAYSTVSPSYHWPTEHPHVVQTRLAVSRDGGENFVGLAQRVNAAFDDPDQSIVDSKLFGGARAVTWQHEVPALVFVPQAPRSERWQLFWHQYPLIDGERSFEFGWIAHKSAANPEQLYLQRATKLFVGSGYAASTADQLKYGGPPRSALNETHGDLVDCVAFTEPGVIAANGSLFLILRCAAGDSSDAGRLIVLENAAGVSAAAGNWRYAGTLLDDRRDAELLGTGEWDFSGFGAPDLFQIRATGQIYLVATPVRPGGWPAYRGCMVFSVVDLATARIQRDGATPRLAAVSNGDAGLHSGACAYLESRGLSAALIQGQVYPESIDRFRLYRTEVRL